MASTNLEKTARQGCSPADKTSTLSTLDKADGETQACSNERSQQEFLRDAMSRLGMKRDEFADRIAVKRKTLDNWLLPSSASARAMPDMAWKFIREILDKTENTP